MKLGTALDDTQKMTITVTDRGERSKSVEFTVYIRQSAAPPRFTPAPDANLRILENLTDDTIITRIKVRYFIERLSCCVFVYCN